MLFTLQSVGLSYYVKSETEVENITEKQSFIELEIFLTKDHYIKVHVYMRCIGAVEAVVVVLENSFMLNRFSCIKTGISYTNI